MQLNTGRVFFIAATILSALQLSTTVTAQKYADKLRSCYQTDPTKFDSCLFELIQGLKADFKTGIKDLAVPVLDPMHIANINFQESATIVQITATFRDVIVRGASEFNLLRVTSDRVKREVKLDLTIPELRINGNYDISGTVLLLPIKGDGTFWLILTGIQATGTGQLQKLADKVNISNMTIDFTIKSIRLRLNNLFGGDVVGDAVNQALNDNSQQVLEDVKPKISQQLSAAVKKIFNNAFIHIPPDAFGL